MRHLHDNHQNCVLLSGVSNSFYIINVSKHWGYPGFSGRHFDTRRVQTLPTELLRLLHGEKIAVNMDVLLYINMWCTHHMLIYPYTPLGWHLHYCEAAQGRLHTLSCTHSASLSLTHTQTHTHTHRLLWVLNSWLYIQRRPQVVEWAQSVSGTRSCFVISAPSKVQELSNPSWQFQKLQ